MLYPSAKSFSFLTLKIDYAHCLNTKIIESELPKNQTSKKEKGG